MPFDIMKRLFSSACICCAILVGCSGPRVGGVRVANLQKWYIPSDTSVQRSAIPLEKVAFLDSVPQGRKFRVIGIIAPPPDAFETMPETINAIRAAASLHGADAVFIDSQQVQEGWNFSVSGFGGSGGKWRKIHIQAKAIVWEQ